LGRTIGAVIGEYRLLECLGSGAAGEVFKAEHLITHRLEAVKFLTHGRPITDEEERRFFREIELHAALQHPNIAAVHTACHTSEGLALVMELVDGEPLSAILERGRLPLADSIRYTRAMLEAIAYAHGCGVVHGDVKPANILVGRGTAKLTDFGLARPATAAQLTSPGAPAGSPYYMSPEQVNGAPFDARSDCYSLGVTLYELVTGRRPFEGESAFEVMLQQRDALPAPPIEREPAIGAELNRVILTSLEKDLARRFQSAAEFQAALERAWTGRPVASRRGAGPWVAAVILAGLALAGAALAPFRRPVPRVDPPPAPQAPAPIVEPAVPGPEPPSPDLPPAPHRKPAPAKHRGAPPMPSPSLTPVAPRPEAKPADNPAVEPPPSSASASASATAASLESDNPARPSQAALPAAPAKRRNIVWRVLGKVVHPWPRKPP
jgi:serine/threonine-protein kinase